MTHPPWDESYTGQAPAPWDIGRPQPAFLRLAEQGLLSGRVLDAGCGTGEHALMAAAHGGDVTGIDVSARAIEMAREKAAERGISVRFEVASALDLGALGIRFDTVIDSGLFHVFNVEDSARYVASLGAALAAGGTVYLMCFSDRQPGDWGPRRVRQEDLRSAFSDGWAVDSITAQEFDLNPGLSTPTAQAWLAVIRRL
ncbi:MAG TPA: class I SAM-dependent methyltransferase [Streptosporangiaceae bacterium]|nr:class I SAM-dependent methyltransferase [Streptosporangiaceae bacterium]